VEDIEFSYKFSSNLKIDRGHIDSSKQLDLEKLLAQGKIKH
jgi:hypothetical protein